jgi:outer membrane protein
MKYGFNAVAIGCLMEEHHSMYRRPIICAFVIGALFSLVGFAQTPTPPPRSTPQTGAASEGGTGAQGKIAIINTAAFRVGIDELRVNLEALSKEFESQGKELEGLQKQIEELKNKVETQGPTVQPSVRNGWMEKGAELERAFKRKSEDYQTLFQKRGQELAGPILDKINKFLGQYSEQHNIVLVLEGEVAASSNLVVWAAPAVEITEDFIKEYNKANPSSAPVAPKK